MRPRYGAYQTTCDPQVARRVVLFRQTSSDSSWEYSRPNVVYIHAMDSETTKFIQISLAYLIFDCSLAGLSVLTFV